MGPLHPSQFRAALEQAAGHHRAGRLAQAAEIYVAVMKAEPGHVDAARLLALAYAGIGRDEDARELLRRLIDGTPKNPLVLHEIGLGFLQIRDAETALDCFERSVAIDASKPDTWYHLGVCFNSLSRPIEAQAALETALALKPNHFPAQLELAGSQIYAGEFERAEETVRRLIAAKPEYADAYGVLTLIRVPNRHADQLDTIKSLIAKFTAEGRNAKSLYTAAARISNDLGRFDEAFGYYSTRNRLYRAPYDHAGMVRRLDEVRSVFTKEFFAHPAGFGSESERPVFIVGMPRSGTSLVEQIIASHPLVFGAGETPDVTSLVRGVTDFVATNSDYPLNVSSLTADGAKALARRYLRQLQRRDSGAKRVTTKTPHDFLHVGLIHLLLPRAKIIHCVRDPVDTCFSCWTNSLGNSHTYRYDLYDLGRYYRQYEKLMTHWQSVIPADNIFECRYETLIDEPNEMARKLVSFTGLDWDERCLEFFDSRRPVTTASVWQVRQRLNREGIGRAQNFAQHLGPLLRGLELEPHSQNLASTQ